jgi:hypothetical protein
MKRVFKYYFLLNVLLMICLFYILQNQTSNFVGVDPYYHVQVSKLGTEIFSKKFPWVQKSLWFQNFGDKEFLFHVYLMPFVILFGDFTGAKFATVLLDAAVFTAFYWVCSRRRVTVPFLWVFVLLAASELFLFRICMTRPHVLSLLLTLLLCEFLLQGRVWAVAGLCAVFALAYTAYHLAVGFAVLFCLNLWMHRKTWNATLISYALMGTLIGIVLHPHFPNNVLIWKVQNFDVLKLNWSNINLGFGGELSPMPGRGFVSESALAFFLSPALLFGAAWKKADLSEDTTFFLFLSFGFLCLTMMSLRFVEYWPVYAILVSACFVRDLNLPIQWDYFDDESHKHKYSKKDIRLGRWATGITLFVVLLFSARTYNHTLIKIEHIGESRIKPAALWMKENIPAKETVFHGDWDDFPELFFYNPNN